MTQPSEPSSHAFGSASVLRIVFAAWSCFLVFFLIPLEFLFRVDAFLNYLPPIHILFNAVFVLLLYLALASVIALLSSLGHVGLASFGLNHYRRKRFTIGANIAVILFGFSYKLLNTAITWARAVTHAEFGSSRLSLTIGIISLVAAISLTVMRPQLVSKVVALSQRTLRPVLIMLGLGLLLVSGQIVRTLVAQSTVRRDVRDTPQSAANKPNIILISLDTLTAKDMSLYGYNLPTTPNLESFSKQCHVFNHAYANSNFTTPGMASILTSKYPVTNKVYSYYNFLSSEIRHENIAHELKRVGYQNIALIANPAGHPNTNGSFRDFDHAPLIDHLHQLTGDSLVDDFQLYLKRLGFHPLAWFGERAVAMTRHLESAWLKFLPARRIARDQLFSRSPDITFGLAHKYLKDAKRPFFLWTHIQAPHSPYLPNASFKHRFLSESIFETASSQNHFSNLHYTADQQPLVDKLRLRYNEHIASSDAAVGDFLTHLAKEGYLENSVVIITADHGEQFEKGFHEHGGAGYMGLYQPLIHIPLLIHLPGQTTTQRIAANAEQVDIAPTILDLLKLPIPRWMEGESLVPGMLGQHSSGKPKFSMNLELCSPRRPITDGSIAVMLGSDKYIYYRRSGKEELYDLGQDPQEESNLVSAFPVKVRAMNKLALKRLGLE